jgi:hypothetical protein
VSTRKESSSTKRPSREETGGKREELARLLDLMASRKIAQAFAFTPVIEPWIEWVASKSRKIGGFPAPPPAPDNEQPSQAEIRLKGHYTTLGIAWTNMAQRIGRFEPNVLRREYYKVIEPTRPVLDEIRQKTYDRLSYYRKRSDRIAAKENRWGEQLDEWLAAIYAATAPSHASVIDSESDDEGYEELLADLTPAERRGVESILSGEPPADGADRQRRCRARKKLRSKLSQNDRVSRLLNEQRTSPDVSSKSGP